MSKDELQHYLRGDEQTFEGITIYTIRDYLRRSTETSHQNQKTDFTKEIEEEVLSDFAEENNLWFTALNEANYFDAGAEQKVYLFSSDKVIKVNKGIFYESWADYFDSILLHNYFFEATRYEFLGFVKQQGKLLTVVQQTYIRQTENTELKDVKDFLESNGFINTDNNNYYHSKLEVFLEDLHEGNIIVQNELLAFIDTIFYLKK